MPVGGCGSETAEEAVAYRRLEALCESIRAEIDNDFQISDHAIFPETVDLIHTTAPKYCKVSRHSCDSILRMGEIQANNGACSQTGQMLHAGTSVDGSCVLCYRD
jgi:hypothetical protein